MKLTFLLYVGLWPGYSLKQTFDFKQLDITKTLQDSGVTSLVRTVQTQRSDVYTLCKVRVFHCYVFIVRARVQCGHADRLFVVIVHIASIFFLSIKNDFARQKFLPTK